MAITTRPMTIGIWPRSPRSRSRSENPLPADAAGASSTTAAVAPGAPAERSSWSPALSMLIRAPRPLPARSGDCLARLFADHRAELGAGYGCDHLLLRGAADVVGSDPLA